MAFREVLRSRVTNWKVVVAGMLMVAMTTTSFYLITVYTPTFGESVLLLASRDALIATLDLFHCTSVERRAASMAL